MFQEAVTSILSGNVTPLLHLTPTRLKKDSYLGEVLLLLSGLLEMKYKVWKKPTCTEIEKEENDKYSAPKLATKQNKTNIPMMNGAFLPLQILKYFLFLLTIPLNMFKAWL